MSPPKICIVGDNCVDLYPVQTKKFVGGNGVNTAVAVQRNGIHCGYLGTVGNDEDGKLIIETLQKEKIDCQRLRQSEGKTAWTIVHLEDGERIFFEDSLEVQIDFELEEKDYQYLKQVGCIIPFFPTGTWKEKISSRTMKKPFWNRHQE